MDYSKRIISNPDIMLGKPIIKGTRITVELILRKISQGMEFNDLLDGYPQLQMVDILAALSYSADVISKEEMIVP